MGWLFYGLCITCINSVLHQVCLAKGILILEKYSLVFEEQPVNYPLLIFGLALCTSFIQLSKVPLGWSQRPLNLLSK